MKNLAEFRNIMALLVSCSVSLGSMMAQEAKRTLTNADVISMAKSGISEQIIILMIQKATDKFDTSPEAVIELKKAGVSDGVLKVILNPSPISAPPTGRSQSPAELPVPPSGPPSQQVSQQPGSPAQTAVLPITLTHDQKWDRTEMAQPLTGHHYTQFSLRGKFLTELTPGATNGATNPVLYVRCIPGPEHHDHTNGKFIEAYLFVGAFVEGSLNKVSYRKDETKPHGILVEPGKDYEEVFFRSFTSMYEFQKLLYTRVPISYKIPPDSEQVRRLIFEVPLAGQNNEVMQFDMPDASEVADACGLLWHN